MSKGSSNVPNAVLIYTLDSGRLPPGITLGIDGQLQGKIRQFGTTGLPGLTTIDKASGAFTLDGATTTIDRSYLTVKAPRPNLDPRCNNKNIYNYYY